MDKKSVAEKLGVGLRAVERYAEQGRLTVRYEKGKTRPVAVYDEKEVDALKAELEATLFHVRPTLALEKANTANPDQALSAISDIRPAQQFAALLEALRPAPASVGEKILLSLKDCTTLTGLSDGYLREAIHAKKLKAKIIGRGYKVKRADLDTFVSKL